MFNFKKLILSFCSFCMALCLIATPEHTFAEEKQNPEPEVYEIYNSQGEYLGESENPELFYQEYLEANNISLYTEGDEKIIKELVLWIEGSFAFRALSFISTVQYTIELGIATVNWVNAHLTFPSDFTGNREIKIFSKTGGVFNPYPPHSLEGAQWERNNFYYAVLK